MIKYLGKGDIDAQGNRTVVFELNGIRRDILIPDKKVTSTLKTVPMADLTDLSQVSAPIPGMVSKIYVKPGDKIRKNQTLMVVEAMKMETNITANIEGVMGEILIKEGVQIKAGELLMKIDVV